MAKNFEIRNSTAEFLTFIASGKEDGVQVFYKNETIWATQKALATLFDVDRTVITKHLKNIFETAELQQDSVCAKFAHTAEDGKVYNTQFYNLDAIISVGQQLFRIDVAEGLRIVTKKELASAPYEYNNPHHDNYMLFHLKPAETEFEGLSFDIKQLNEEAYKSKEVFAVSLVELMKNKTIKEITI